MASVLSFPKLKPSKADIEQNLQIILECDIDQMAGDLVLARAIWRANRALVEAEVIPEPFRSHLKKEGYALTQRNDEFKGADNPSRLTRRIRRKNMRRAVDWARATVAHHATVRRSGGAA